MKESDFDQLLLSIEQAGRIKRGEAAIGRRFKLTLHVSSVDDKEEVQPASKVENRNTKKRPEGAQA